MVVPGRLEYFSGAQHTRKDLCWLLTDWTQRQAAAMLSLWGFKLHK